jgi:hypothetical protein
LKFSSLHIVSFHAFFFRASCRAQCHDVCTLSSVIISFGCRVQ